MDGTVLFRCLEQVLWQPANRSNLVCVHAAVGASVVEFRHGDDLSVYLNVLNIYAKHRGSEEGETANHPYLSWPQAVMVPTLPAW